MYFKKGVIKEGKFDFIPSGTGFTIGDKGQFDKFLTDHKLSIQNAGNNSWDLNGGGLNGACKTYLDGIGFDTTQSFLDKKYIQYKSAGKSSTIGCVAVPLENSRYMFYQVGPYIPGREHDPEVIRELILSNYNFFKCVTDNRLSMWNRKVVYSGVSNGLWGGTLKSQIFNGISVIDYINALSLRKLAQISNTKVEIRLGKGISDALFEMQNNEQEVLNFIKSTIGDEAFNHFIKPLTDKSTTMYFFNSLNEKSKTSNVPPKQEVKQKSPQTLALLTDEKFDFPADQESQKAKKEIQAIRKSPSAVKFDMDAINYIWQMDLGFNFEDGALKSKGVEIPQAEYLDILTEKIINDFYNLGIPNGDSAQFSPTGYATPRTVHDGRHAYRVARIVNRLAKELNLDKKETIEAIVYALTHDSARKGEGADYWDRESSLLGTAYLERIGIPPSETLKIFGQVAVKHEASKSNSELTIAQKIALMVDAADTIDIRRCKDGFKMEMAFSKLIKLGLDEDAAAKIIAEDFDIISLTKDLACEGIDRQQDSALEKRYYDMVKKHQIVKGDLKSPPKTFNVFDYNTMKKKENADFQKIKKEIEDATQYIASVRTNEPKDTSKKQEDLLSQQPSAPEKQAPQTALANSTEQKSSDQTNTPHATQPVKQIILKTSKIIAAEGEKSVLCPNISIIPATDRVVKSFSLTKQEEQTETEVATKETITICAPSDKINEEILDLSYQAIVKKEPEKMPKGISAIYSKKEKESTSYEIITSDDEQVTVSYPPKTIVFSSSGDIIGYENGKETIDITLEDETKNNKKTRAEMIKEMKQMIKKFIKDKNNMLINGNKPKLNGEELTLEGLTPLP